jgi:heme exporter protein B
LSLARKFWWIVHKDLVSECRAWQVWPATLLLAITAGCLFGIQIDLPPKDKLRIVGSLYWLTISLAGVFTIARSFASEREDGCWDGFMLYPIAAPTVYLAKCAVHAISLAAVQVIAVPLFAFLTGVHLLAYPWKMLLIALLVSVGVSSVGTLLGALLSGAGQCVSLLALLGLPMVIPLLLAASEATSLIAVKNAGPDWWRSIQLLAAFAFVFVTAGMMLFEFLLED